MMGILICSPNNDYSWYLFCSSCAIHFDSPRYIVWPVENLPEEFGQCCHAVGCSKYLKEGSTDLFSTWMELTRFIKESGLQFIGAPR